GEHETDERAPSHHSEPPLGNLLDIDARDLGTPRACRVHRHHVEALRTFDDEKPFEAVHQVEAERLDIAAVDPGGRVRFELLSDELADLAAGERELLAELHRLS